MNSPPAGTGGHTTRVDGLAVVCTCGTPCGECATPAEAADRRWRHAITHAPWRTRPSRRVRLVTPRTRRRQPV